MAERFKLVTSLVGIFAFVVKLVNYTGSNREKVGQVNA